MRSVGHPLGDLEDEEEPPEETVPERSSRPHRSSFPLACASSSSTSDFTVSLQSFADCCAAERPFVADPSSFDGASFSFFSPSDEADGNSSWSNPMAPGTGPHPNRSGPSSAFHVSASTNPVSGSPAPAWK